MLGPSDPLPSRPRRVLVAGTSGAGKTTLAARVSAVTGAPHVEIDALFHGPGWTPRPSFEADVLAFCSESDWVTEWQYHHVRDLLADRADLMVWLDLPRATVMRQVVGRTLRRRLRREPLWNGNLEPPLHTVFTDPEHILRWAWSTHHLSSERMQALQQRRPGLPMVRLLSRNDVDRWLAGPLAEVVTP